MPGKSNHGPSVTHFPGLRTEQPVAVLCTADLLSVGLGELAGSQLYAAGQTPDLAPNSGVAEVGNDSEPVSEPFTAYNAPGSTTYVIFRKSPSTVSHSGVLQKGLFVRESITTLRAREIQTSYDI